MSAENQQATPAQTTPQTSENKPLETSTSPEIKSDKTSVPGEPVKVPSRFKVKIDNEEKEVDEQELISNYQLRQASQKRFQEAAELRKQVENVIKILKTDPKRALSDPTIGVNVREFAEKVLAEELQNELLSPEQRRIKDLERMIEEGKAKEKEAADAKAKENEAKLAEHYLATYKQTVEEALKLSGLPNNKKTWNRMVDYLQEYANYQIQLPAADLARIVRQEFEADIKELFGASEATTLASLLGDDKMKALRALEIAKIASPEKVAPTPAEQPPEKDRGERSNNKKKTTKMKDFFKQVRDDIAKGE